MDVSIIIINYNTEGLILNCLDSIFQKTEYVKFEIIVVDNNSTRKPKSLPIDTRIQYIQSKRNLGFGKANNLGAQYAKGEFILFLNPDTLLINNAIKALHDYISKREYVGACGPNLYTKELTPNLSFSTLKTGIWQEFVDSRGFTKNKFNKSFNDTNICLSVPFVSGAAMMVRKKIFDDVGGFSNKFFMYYEDNDLCLSITRKGYQITNIPYSKIIHLDGQSFTFKKEREILSLRGRKTFYKKNYGIAYFYLSSIIYILNNIINLSWFKYKKKTVLAESYLFRIKNILRC